MKIIVGLGNPGREYEQTRHNAGFMVLDRLVRRHQISGPKMKFQAGVLEGQVAAEKCLLMQPVTYMNRSGQAVNQAVQFYKLQRDDLIIVVDDVALPCGKIRLRAEGSCGGHNGLEDIERALGSSLYSRLRIGIDPPGRVPQRDYVLGRFTESQRQLIEPAIEKACDAIECWIREGIDKAMSIYNADDLLD